MKQNILHGLVLSLLCLNTYAQNTLPPNFNATLETAFPRLDSLYKQLHQYPETAGNEVWTSQTLAVEMAQLGFEVHDSIGGYGLVCILRNGPGDTVLYRVEMDGLEIREQTGLPYASRRHSIGGACADTVWYMHACSHDMHMTVWLGTARMLVQHLNAWQGVLICIAQPAEENGAGAKAMIDAGIFERFGRPKCAVALHDDAGLVSGAVAVVAGPAMAHTTGMDITLHGRSMHGGYPHLGIDVMVMAARCILAFQTIISRELEPGTPAVISVGKITGGSRRNQVPDALHMELTLRSYNPKTNAFLIRRIREICEGISISAGVKPNLLPKIEIVGHETPTLVNDLSLTNHARQVFNTTLGSQNVVVKKPVMGGEDFSRYGLTNHHVPILLFWLGTVAPDDYAAAQSGEKELPSLHSSRFAPLASTTIRTGVTATTALLMSLLPRKI